MMENIVKTCKNFNKALDRHFLNEASQEDLDIVQYIHLDLAKAIIKDIDETNAKRVARIILGYIE